MSINLAGIFARVIIHLVTGMHIRLLIRLLMIHLIKSIIPFKSHQDIITLHCWLDLNK